MRQTRRNCWRRWIWPSGSVPIPLPGRQPGPCRSHKGEPLLELRRILCPVDFSEFSVRAYGYALALAERYRAKLVVQHVVELWHYPSAGFAATAELYEEFSRTLREKAK